MAILRLLAAYGVKPDIVAGHSLGEYAAAVAAGILSFKDALLAVSARGREMANVQIEDKGRMAGIASGEETVQEVLAEIPGYVVPANKNCPTQTVIAGESDAVEAAIEAFRSRGITVYPLPVSHAFHSRIVAPASEPLKRVLQRLDVQPPKRPITTNVTSRYYPTGEGAVEKIIENLASQVAAPVEWTAQIERMYADGARIFVECGPKRALAGFVVNILKRRPHLALYTNHPKRGGICAFRDSLAGLVAVGMPLKPEPEPGMPDIFGESEPRRATTEALRQRMVAANPTSSKMPGQEEASSEVVSQVLEIVSQLTGYTPSELSLDDELEADLGIDTVKQAELIAIVRDHFRLDHDPGFRISDYRTLRDLARYAGQRLGSVRPAGLPSVTPRFSPSVASGTVPVSPSLPTSSLPADALRLLMEGALNAGLSGGNAQDVAQAVMPALQGLVNSLVAAVESQRPTTASVAVAAPSTSPGTVHSTPSPVERVVVQAPAKPIIVASGVSVGLPGGQEVFAEDNFERIFAGENRISNLSDEDQDRFLAKKVVRLSKDPKTGQGTFVAVEKREQVLRLAGTKSHFDLVADYGVDAGLARALDVATQLAFAAGLEALKDAGIPLVRTWRDTTTGKRVPTGWALPESMRKDTGVIFASAFPGYSKLVEHIKANGDDGEGRFDRRFLFQILAMGHSQFAQLIGAQGPNTQVNAACASTTQAISIAQDWIECGRCQRVVVVGSDDVTNETLLEWIGTGFLAAGAATTTAEVEKAALPFDSRRHGMILGMGAVGLVLEQAEDVAQRGMAPIARLLASRIANSAFHGTRLHPTHISDEMDELVAEAVNWPGRIATPLRVRPCL